jgi:hypothetical protein
MLSGNDAVETIAATDDRQVTEDGHNRPISESRVLTSMYGTEERFQAMVADELASLASSQLILNFLKQKAVELGTAAGGKALQWVSAELLKAFGLGGDTKDLEKIKSLLRQVLENQRLILSKLEELLREVQFQHLITRSFDAVEGITNIYERLQLLSTIKDEKERESEAARIKAGILDTNLGTLLNLKKISDVLLGKDPIGKSDPLINLFVDRWFPVYTARQLKDDIPLSTYHTQLDAWMHGLFIIQYMGLAELANARVANGEFELLKAEIEQTIQQMNAQHALLAEAIPDWTRKLPDMLFEDRWYVVRGRDLQKGRIDNSQVLYGSPAAGSYLDYTVQFRGRHRNNGDEEWQFEKSGQNDTFYLRERSRPNYISLKDSRVKMDRSRVKLRLVMGRTNDPAVKPDARRRDLYVPVIGLVGRGDYLTWTRGGTNIVRVGSLDKAVRVEIVQSTDAFAEADENLS